MKQLKSFSIASVLMISLGMIVVAADAVGAREKKKAVSLHFDVNFDDDYKRGDKFDPTGEKPVNEIKAKPAGRTPYRKCTDIRNDLGGNTGDWTATVAKDKPFTSNYLRFEVPTGQKVSGRFELFKVPENQSVNEDTWFLNFDYCRFTAAETKKAFLEIQFKNRWGKIMAKPAMWYNAWLGNWRDTKSNRELRVNTVHNIRYEIDMKNDTYAVYVDDEKVESGKADNANSFGGVSFVFMNETAGRDMAFGLDNIRIGKYMSGSPVKLGALECAEAGNLFVRSETDLKTPFEFSLPVKNLLEEDAEARVTLTLRDEENDLRDVNLGTVTVGPQEIKMVPVSVTVPTHGWYELAFKLQSEGETDTRMSAFSVLRPPAEGVRPDSMFGINLRAYTNEDDLAICRKLGVKWKRGINQKYTYPGKVSPAPGEWWSEETQVAARADVDLWKEKSGVISLGYISYNIPWNVSLDENGKKRPVHMCPPRDMKAHAEMVKRLIDALGDKARYWELWNEPGGQFWGGTSDQYREMLKTVWETVKPEHPDIKLISGGHYMWISRDWVYAPQHDDAGYCDGIALHPYQKPGLWSPVSPALDAALTKKYARGSGGGLWMTEVGTPAHWHFKGVPEREALFHVARSIAPVYLLSKLGAGDMDIKIFWFMSDYGKRGPLSAKKWDPEKFNIFDYERPMPVACAYSAMTHFVEDGVLAGDLLVDSKKGWALHFQKPDGSSVVALWPETEWPRMERKKADLHKSTWTIPGGAIFKAYDYLGRPAGTVNDAGALSLTMKTRKVHYLVTDRPLEEVKQAFAGISFDKLDRLRIAPQPITRPLATKPPLVVRVRNDAMQPQSVTLTLKTGNGIVLENPVQAVPDLKPGETRHVRFAVASATPNDENRYPVEYTATVGDYAQGGSQEVQVACATYGTPTIDADLSDWADATFVSIRHRGPLSDWWKITPSMTYGKGYRLATKWDDNYLYVAAEIPDHTSRLDDAERGGDDLEYKSKGNDRLHVGFNLIENNPDDLLVGHSHYDKSLASDIDYEFSSEMRKQKDGAEKVVLRRRLAPGTLYQGGDRPKLTPPTGPMDASAESGEDGRIAVVYDTEKQVYRHEFAIAWKEIPELRAALKDLQPGQDATAAFGFMVYDGHKWESPTKWCEENGDLEFGAYGFGGRVGTPCWLADYGTRLLAQWGFLR